MFLNPNGSVSSPPESNVAMVAIDVTPVNDVAVSPDLDLGVPEDSQLVSIGDLRSGVFEPGYFFASVSSPYQRMTLAVGWAMPGA